MSRERYTFPGIEEYARAAEKVGRKMVTMYGTSLTESGIELVSRHLAHSIPECPHLEGALLLASSHIAETYRETIRPRGRFASRPVDNQTVNTRR